MKRSVSFLLICYVIIGSVSLNFLAWSLAPRENTNRPVGSANENTIVKGSQGFLRALPASPTEDIGSVSSDKVIGPALPLIQGSSKRLFLVRHGEVINPGEERQDGN